MIEKIMVGLALMVAPSLLVWGLVDYLGGLGALVVLGACALFYALAWGRGGGAE
jgi:hypothetical protein